MKNKEIRSKSIPHSNNNNSHGVLFQHIKLESQEKKMKTKKHMKKCVYNKKQSSTTLKLLKNRNKTG